jgi:hypothetical protein
MRTPIALLTAALAFAISAKGQTTAQLQAEIALLKSSVTALQNSVAALQSKSAGNQATDTTQSATLAAVQRQVTLIAQNPVLATGPFVKLDVNPENGVIGPNIVFTGANIHIVSGSGTTVDQTGKGNLIIGYNPAPIDMQVGERSGSHNIITGEENTFTGSGGVVFGFQNSLLTSYASILGGSSNVILSGDGELAVIVGGYNNVARGTADVVVGGWQNGAEGTFTAILGGTGNRVDGGGSVVVAGHGNQTQGPDILEGSGIDGTVNLSGVLSGPITFVTPPPSAQTPMP